MQKHTILYVDDEADNLTAFRAVFRRHYNVLLAGSGEQAIGILQKQDVQIIISDQRMPGMTGVEFFEKIKDQYPDAIRIVLTGYSDMQAIIDAINKGKVYHYVSKPWKADAFKVIIDRALDTLELRQQNRELERRNVQAQFQILKNQINPHFLFNSMNILAALIPKDPDKAIKFTKGFSNLYRSVLKLRDQPLISLKEELAFVADYMVLQKMRFDEDLQVDIAIPDGNLQAGLPPFALQILVENAVKHNVISEDAPLQLSIKVEGDWLLVSNNHQPRAYVEDSTGLGLSNLRARYEVLGAPELQAGEENGHYVARIPLIPEA